jgi:putative hydrolase of the HAD superfamily
MPSASNLDAVTVDAAGTCLDLVAPYVRLQSALASRGIERSLAEVEEAFAAEVAYYVPRSERGAGPEGLAGLRHDAVAVFLEHARVDIDAGSFVAAFMETIEFRAIPGAVEALEALRAAGLELACVANWDATLHGHLEHAGLAPLFTTAVSSADAGAAKPDPAIFQTALSRLGVPGSRALHIGDDDVDRDGARAAGMAFEPVPLATLPQRLGLREVPA